MSRQRFIRQHAASIDMQAVCKGGVIKIAEAIEMENEPHCPLPYLQVHLKQLMLI